MNSAALVPGGLAIALAAPLLLANGEAPQLSPAWRVVGLPAQTKPRTTFAPDVEADHRGVRIDAHLSYGNLVQPLPPGAHPTRLRWSWRVGQMSPAIHLDRKGGDDAPARVCLGFDWPDERVPFVERQLLRLARARTSEALPGATLCWVWGGPEAPGSLVTSPYTARVRSIVLHNAAQVGAGWQHEERDVLSDLRRAFGDEWPPGAPPPPATALIVGADADNTASHSTAWVADLELH